MTGTPLQVISLIGLRGSGKTSVAPLLAEVLGWSWIDADVEIERRAGCTIRDIFLQQGEPAFRDLESEVLAELLTRSELVLAAGGGAVLRAENRRHLRAAGPVVWLQASVDTLRQRIARDPRTAESRPSLTGDDPQAEIEQLLIERRPWYAEAATLIVATDGLTPARVVDEILMELAPLLPKEPRL